MRRYDVSSVPLQGSYVAKQCPVRAQNNLILEDLPHQVLPALDRRFEQGRQFEESIVSQLLELYPDAQVVDGAASSARAEATLRAISASAPLILGGQLPPDHEGRRFGRADLLVLSPDGGLPSSRNQASHGWSLPST